MPRPAPRSYSPLGLAVSILALLPIAAAPGHGHAQVEAGASVRVASAPTRVADEFHRSFQSMVWEGLAERLHPDALAYLRLSVEITVDADSSGWALEKLLGGVPDRAAFDALSDAAVLVRVMSGVEREVPGLFSSLVSRRSEILGQVDEGPDTAHVVYRIVTLAQGAEPRVRALTLTRVGERWLVRFAEEIDVLHTALRRIPIPRGAGGQPGGGSPSGRVTPG
jgi:hypothetical protein